MPSAEQITENVNRYLDLVDVADADADPAQEELPVQLGHAAGGGGGAPEQHADGDGQ